MVMARMYKLRLLRHNPIRTMTLRICVKTRKKEPRLQSRDRQGAEDRIRSSIRHHNPHRIRAGPPLPDGRGSDCIVGRYCFFTQTPLGAASLATLRLTCGEIIS